MGLFDEIYISSDIADSWQLNCPKCAEPLSSPYQSKDINGWASMDVFFLELSPRGVICLKGGDYRPELYKVLSSKEAEDLNKERDEWDKEWKTWFSHRYQEGELFIEQEDMKPENLIRHSMGELPHCHTSMCTSCTKCHGLVDLHIKFTDGVGVLTKIEYEPLGDVRIVNIFKEKEEPND